MSTIVTPQANIEGGRAAQIRYETPDTGNQVARLGGAIAEMGERIEGDRLRSESTRARIELQRRLNETRLEFEEIGDPDEIDRLWPERMGALREELTGAVDPKIREDIGFAFDELSDRHGFALGSRAVALRQSRATAELNQFTREVESAAPAMDPDTSQTMLDQLADSMADAVARGVLTPEEADSRLVAARSTVERTAALRLLEEDPDGLLASIDNAEAPGFTGIEGPQRESLRSRAISAIAAREAAAAKVADVAAKERETALGAQLRDARDIARKGRLGAAEIALLEDPEAQAHEDYPEFAAAVQLREFLPDFHTLTPAEMKLRIDEERARPVGEKFETNVLDAMQTAHDAAVTAWTGDDPLGHAADVFGPATGTTPVPELPAFTATEAGSFVQALAERRGYARALTEAGYLDEPVLFRPEERAMLRGAASVDARPEERMALAVTLKQALGPDAKFAFRELETDTVFSHMGGMLLAGGRGDVVEEAFVGQQALKEGNVTLPSERERNALVMGLMGPFSVGRDRMVAQVRDAADALYAARARGVDPKEGLEIYEQALQEALGASVDRKGRATGGVREVNGGMMPLPIGVSAERIEDALDRASAAVRGGRLLARPDQVSVLGRGAVRASEGDGLDRWARIASTEGVPHYKGAPLDARTIGRLRFRPVAGDVYAAYVEQRGQQFRVETEDGQEWRFSMSGFLREFGE